MQRNFSLSKMRCPRHESFHHSLDEASQLRFMMRWLGLSQQLTALSVVSFRTVRQRSATHESAQRDGSDRHALAKPRTPAISAHSDACRRAVRTRFKLPDCNRHDRPGGRRSEPALLPHSRAPPVLRTCPPAILTAAAGTSSQRFPQLARGFHPGATAEWGPAGGWGTSRRGERHSGCSPGSGATGTTTG